MKGFDDMEHIKYERQQGDALFGEMVSDIKRYVHEQFSVTQRVPTADEVLANINYAGNVLNNFLKGIQPVMPCTVNQYVFRLFQMLEAAKYEYERGKIA